jgi:hypothetical protein
MTKDTRNRQKAEDVLKETASLVEPVTSRFKGPRISEELEASLRDIVEQFRRQSSEEPPPASSVVVNRPIGLKVLLVGGSNRENALLAASIAGDIGKELYRADLGSLAAGEAGPPKETLRLLLEAAEARGCMLLLDNLDRLLASPSHQDTAGLELRSLLESIKTHPCLILLGMGSESGLDPNLTSNMDFVLPLSGAGRA